MCWEYEESKSQEWLRFSHVVRSISSHWTVGSSAFVSGHSTSSLGIYLFKDTVLPVSTWTFPAGFRALQRRTSSSHTTSTHIQHTSVKLLLLHTDVTFICHEQSKVSESPQLQNSHDSSCNAEWSHQQTSFSYFSFITFTKFDFSFDIIGSLSRIITVRNFLPWGFFSSEKTAVTDCTSKPGLFKVWLLINVCGL